MSTTTKIVTNNTVRIAYADDSKFASQNADHVLPRQDAIVSGLQNYYDKKPTKIFVMSMSETLDFSQHDYFSRDDTMSEKYALRLRGPKVKVNGEPAAVYGTLTIDADGFADLPEPIRSLLLGPNAMAVLNRDIARRYYDDHRGSTIV